MRSRYVAFKDKNFEYLKRTWHPETIPSVEELENKSTVWLKLEILESNDTEVEFKAYFKVNGRIFFHHELSIFKLVENKLYYHSAKQLKTNELVSQPTKSSLCICGSGKKFKRCHFTKS